MPVLGMGGLFFRAQDPDALSEWYRQHLGVGAGCDTTGEGAADEWYWRVQGGPMVFAPFKANTDYFPLNKAFMMNLRVSDLTGMIAQLSASGIAVETRPEWDSAEAGRFARIHDPEGNAIELWEPPAA